MEPLRGMEAAILTVMAEEKRSPSPQSNARPSKRLGTETSSDVRALSADLENARRIAEDAQRELLGKSSELASMKELFDKARKHLIQLQLNVTQLRDERHKLANRAMEADALEQKLKVVTADRDRLRALLDASHKWQG